ncbi:PLDc N-terminal domain-containing protein [Pontibacter pudoricolor]|uniref:PLDc N-terminal domain-containing protein n=1 Tax=Pontibacter pudoricolor TaxID=2694930 RepID=UPI001390EB8C|nr:PLDc N-terminal domain-containing protein [Pontibacter pudoricolor]
MEFLTSGNSSLVYSIVFTLLIIYYGGAFISLIHLIFKTNYNLTERLLWMLVLWLLPIIGLVFYWVSWKRRSRN